MFIGLVQNIVCAYLVPRPLNYFAYKRKKSLHLILSNMNLNKICILLFCSKFTMRLLKVNAHYEKNRLMIVMTL